ncbi:MAG: NUDIX domain-containing protein [Candidatus Saccharimonas sp.]
MSEIANVLLVSRAIISYENRILLLQRSKRNSNNPGLWEFAGGKVEAGEGIDDGLTREVYEETGLSIELSPPPVHAEVRTILDAGKYQGRLYVALFYTAQKLAGELAISDEHEAAVWSDPLMAGNFCLTQYSRLALEAFIGQRDGAQSNRDLDARIAPSQLAYQS